MKKAGVGNGAIVLDGGRSHHVISEMWFAGNGGKNLAVDCEIFHHTRCGTEKQGKTVRVRRVEWMLRSRKNEIERAG